MNPSKNFSQQISKIEDLPQGMERILSKLERIELLLTNSPPLVEKKPPVTTKELCKFLGVTPPCLLRYRKKGVLPYLNIGSKILFDLDKVLLAIENNKIKNFRRIK